MHRQLAVLHEEFVRTATLFGKIIISERFIPDKQKTVQPLDVGGRAGGIKYIVEGVLFKFAWDSNNLYGGDLKAGKAANHGMFSCA